MNINRNNYEEYFLLYADNELTQTEKKVVEIFLQENVDLKEEFLMIRMTVNSPEKEIKLLDKSFLLKTEPAFINENNYDEIFVLYHDNELSEEQKRETEKFIAENPTVKNDFELLGKTKSVADNSIVYPNKKELYRKEKSGKVIPLVWWKSLAAAVLVGFGLWIAVSYFNKNEVHQPIATTIKHPFTEPEIKKAKPEPVVKQHSENKEESIASSTKNKEPEKLFGDESKNKRAVATEEKIKKESTAKPETKVAPAEEKIKLIKPEMDFQLASNEPIKDLPETIETPVNSLPNNQSINAQEKININSKPNYAHTVSYVSDADQKNDNYVFYDVSTEDFKKSKVGGFLKKVKRIVERTNPIARLLGDEEQQLAAK